MKRPGSVEINPPKRVRAELFKPLAEEGKEKLAEASIYIFRCAFCKFARKSKAELYDHYSFVHYRNDVMQKLDSALNKCFKCETTFKNWQALAKHYIRVHDSNTIDSKKSTLNLSAVESFDKKKKVEVNCEQCFSKFCTTGSLNKHILAVHEGVKFDCDECNTKFSSKTNLSRHNSVFHPIAQPTHRGEKPYICEKCLKSFNQKSNMKMHMGVHTKVRAYVCPACKKDFTTKYHQRRHFSKQHSSSYERKLSLSKDNA